mmetsp:Transcript_27645/g.54350  ORF Transcript_27645/g.54350 Transcript_27645/m.54350 type:complete len:238 (-) Transcript_27645:464-1177(-)
MRSNLCPHTMPCLSAPTSDMCSVTEGPTACDTTSEFVLRYWSIVSSAILRYVVHFPPMIDTKPESVASTACVRDNLAVFCWDRSLTRGRIPLQADSTSSRVIRLSRYLALSLRIKLTSCSVGAGVIVISLLLSVVPAKVVPSQGKKKRTRPSSVLGTMRPVSAGEKWSGRITCTPAAGLMTGSAAGLSSCRTLSANTPVALTTPLHFTLYLSPLRVSSTTAPQIWPCSSLMRSHSLV